MRTTKPISTISFNTPDYLTFKLEELIQAKIISFWAFIVHLPEDDEGGKKEHCHVYIEPSRLIQTDDLKEHLKEFDPANPSKPLGCINFRSSKFADWYLYALHDRRYLAAKGQSRKHQYSHGDIVTSDADDLLFQSRSIDLMALSPYESMIDAQKHGISFEEFFARGTVPIQLIRQYEQAWHILAQNYTFRDGRPGHANELVSDPGSDPGSDSGSDPFARFAIPSEDDIWNDIDPVTGIPTYYMPCNPTVPF